MYPYFSNYLSKCINQTININDEINKFKRDNPNNRPIIVFDFISSTSMIMPNNFNQRKLEMLCAGRFNEASSRAKIMFEKFKNLGVKMVFFVDGYVKRDKLSEWSKRRNNDYISQKKNLFQKLSYNNSENLMQLLGGNLLKSYFDNYLDIAKNYGEVFVSLENECDIDILQYVIKTKAFALFASDLDFILMKNFNCKIWSTKNFNFRKFSVTETNKDKLKNQLKITNNQLPILILLSRKSYSHPDIFDIKENSYIKKIMESTNGKFSVLANFVTKHFPSGIPLLEQEFNMLCEILYDDGRLKKSLDWVKEQVRRIQDFYNNNEINNIPLKNDENLTWLHKHIEHTNSTLVYTILFERPITISHNYIDLSIPNTRSFADLVIPLIRHQMGIVLYDNESNLNPKQIEIFHKPSDAEDYKSQFFTPIYPDKKIPNIKDILDNENKNNVSLEMKFSLLSWIITLKFDEINYSIFIKYQKTQFLIPLITLYYLVKNKHFTVEEADIILLSIYQSVKGISENISGLPKNINPKAFWIAFTYTQILYFFRNSFIVCGLNDYIEFNCFDGFIFHNLYSLKDNLNDLWQIESYRIYANVE